MQHSSSAGPQVSRHDTGWPGWLPGGLGGCLRAQQGCASEITPSGDPEAPAGMRGAVRHHGAEVSGTGATELCIPRIHLLHEGSRAPGLF